MVAWLFAVLASASPAQPLLPAPAQYIVRAWDTSGGLPQNTVTSIVQTRDGYLWLGTFGGLVRFDGLTFTVFDPSNSPGLASARVVSLSEDREGVLWIGTEAGLTRYDKGRFTSYNAADGLPRGAVLCTVRDTRGRLWVGTEIGLGRFDGRVFSIVPTPVPVAVMALTEGPDGAIWAGTWGGVAHFDRDGNAARLLPIAGDNQVTRAVLFARDGTLWAGGYELSRWDGSRFVDVPLPMTVQARGGITALAEDARGGIWAGSTKAGAFEWRDGIVTRYGAAEGVSNDTVRSVLADSGGNVWIGTEVGGLNRLKQRHVFSYQRPGATGQSLAPIVGDGANGLWIGAACGGLFHFDRGVFHRYSDPNAWSGCVWALHRDPDGMLWLGTTTGGGLLRFDGAHFTSYSKAFGLPNDIVAGIARDREGRLWVGTDHALSRWDGSRFINYGAAEGLTHDVRCIFEDHRGVLWVGGLGGLSTFENGRFTRITTAQGLSHDHVRAIYEDTDGVLWIGTYGGGLNRLKDGHFTVVGMAQGLPDNAISRIIEDARGNLWMSGNKGVFRVARSQLNAFAEGRIPYVTAVSYGVADGMVTDETNGGQPAGWQTPDGKLWFPTIKGLVGIDPVETTAVPPAVMVEHALVNGREVAPSTLAALGPGSVDAEFRYTAIDLGAAEKTRFRYRLEGYDTGWIDSGTRRVAYYTKIAPGHYTFDVIATDSNGTWSFAPARVAVVIVPFWWQRRSAITAGVALLLAVTAFIVRHVSLRRARARVADLERERVLERERTRIARDLHDDLGARLSHIAILAGAPASAARDARVTRDLQAAVETMDELVWAVNARNDTVESFANYIARFAEDHVAAAGLRCRLMLPADIPPRILAADVRRHLYLVVKEAINNALKHARASEIRLDLRVEPHALVLEVADDGRGLPPDLDPTGNGLKNFRERMASVGGTVEVASAPDAGTRLVFRTPLQGA